MSSARLGVIKTVAHDKITTTASPIVSTRIIVASVHPPVFPLSSVQISSGNSQENYESVRDPPSDRVRTSICTRLRSDVGDAVQRGWAGYSLRNLPSTDPKSIERFTRVSIFTSRPTRTVLSQCRPLLMAQPHWEQSGAPPKMQGSTRVCRSAV